jgi:hypothetical protein
VIDGSEAAVPDDELVHVDHAHVCSGAAPPDPIGVRLPGGRSSAMSSLTSITRIGRPYFRISAH